MTPHVDGVRYINDDTVDGDGPLCGGPDEDPDGPLERDEGARVAERVADDPLADAPDDELEEVGGDHDADLAQEGCPPRPADDPGSGRRDDRGQ